MFYCFKLKFRRYCSPDSHFSEELSRVSRYYFTVEMISNFNGNVSFTDPGRTKQNYQKIFHWNISPEKTFIRPRSGFLYFRSQAVFLRHLR